MMLENCASFLKVICCHFIHFQQVTHLFVTTMCTVGCSSYNWPYLAVNYHHQVTPCKEGIFRNSYFPWHELFLESRVS